MKKRTLIEQFFVANNEIALTTKTGGIHVRGIITNENIYITTFNHIHYCS